MDITLHWFLGKLVSFSIFMVIAYPILMILLNRATGHDPLELPKTAYAVTVLLYPTKEPSMWSWIFCWILTPIYWFLTLMFYDIHDSIWIVLVATMIYLLYMVGQVVTYQKRFG